MNGEEIIYDYPFMRLGDSLISYQKDLDRYAFRVNETSRFYMHLGSHQMITSAILRLTDLRDIGSSLIGK